MVWFLNLALATLWCAAATPLLNELGSDMISSAECDDTSMLSLKRWRANSSEEAAQPAAPDTFARLGKVDVTEGSKGPLVLIAMIFGLDYMKQPSFRQFLRSAEGCGADVIIAGDAVPKDVLLPHNVVNNEISWDQVSATLEQHFNDRNTLSGLRNWSGHNYATAGLKPLLALLLPEQVRGYDWWGWIDVDMWLGDVTPLLRLQDADSDFWSPTLYLRDGKKLSLGPFSVMRNVPRMNNLLEQPAYRSMVKAMLEQTDYVNFDEWGENYDGSTRNYFNQSFSYVLKHANYSGAIRVSDWLEDAGGQFGWDGHCSSGEDLDSDCGFCRLDISASGRSRIFSLDGTELMFCHMQFGKQLPDFQKSCSASLGEPSLTYTFRAGVHPTLFRSSAALAEAPRGNLHNPGVHPTHGTPGVTAADVAAGDAVFALVFVFMGMAMSKLAMMIGEDVPKDGEDKFAYGEVDVIYPSRLNCLHKVLTLAMAVAGFAYLAYLWTHRRNDQPILAGLICLGEGFCVFVSIVTRFQMWHRQCRVICRLDGLKPGFPKEDWPKVELLWTHYLEPPELSRDPLEYALNMDYPPEKLVLTIGDDGYHVRRKGETGTPSPDQYEVTEIGLEMERVIRNTLSDRLKAGEQITETRQVVQAKEHRTDGRPEGAPGGLTIIEFRGPGLPLVKLVGRMKGEVTFSRAGNIENGVWNSLEEDSEFMALLDVDMKPEPDFMQIMLAPFFQLSQAPSEKASQDEAKWRPNWKVGWTSSPQFFENIESIYGAEDPLNQANKLYWQIFPAASDREGLVHFWGTNAIFFVPALKDSGGFVYGCITEDNATSYSMHQMGWSSVFVSKRLAIGLSRETVTESFDQRKRWLMGNIQQLMAGWDVPFMHKNFRDAPYRKWNRHRLRGLQVEDEKSPGGQKVALGDTGAEFRWKRRVQRWWRIKLELHYMSTKFSFAFAVQPIWLYALALILMCRDRFPINVDSAPLFGYCDAIKTYHIVIVYAVLAYISQIVYCSDSIADSNNPYAFSLQLWRDPFTYSWVRILGAIDGIASAYTGKQLKWNVYGAVSETNLVFALPNLFAFLSLAVVGGHGLVQIYLGDVSLESTIARICYACFIMFMLLPVVTCIIAEMLKLPHYVLRNLTVECLAMTFMLCLCLSWLKIKANQVWT
jgi:cellulose synthase/poly-beta-1,6-N-acetylglucosamine synthase-like glycosyltransferase